MLLFYMLLWLPSVYAADEQEPSCAQAALHNVRSFGRSCYTFADQLVFLSSYAWMTRWEQAESGWHNLQALFGRERYRPPMFIDDPKKKEKQD